VKPDRSAQELIGKWRQGFLPIIDGIVWPSGVLESVRVAFQRKNGRFVLARGSVSRSSLQQLESLGRLSWTRVGKCCEGCDQARGLRAIGGAGGMGGDGFVALESGLSDSLIWIAFFENSNPFEGLRFEGLSLVGSTSLGDQWFFPLESPSDFQIISSDVPSDVSATAGDPDPGEGEA
jgi:hypothetical protein